MQIDLEKIKKEISTDIEKIEPELNEIIEESEEYKFFLFDQIRKVEKYITPENKAKNKDFPNPFKNLEKLEKYNLNYNSDNKVTNIYMNYLVNLYFCAEQSCEYFNILKEKYSDIKIMNVHDTNIENKSF